ncbi:MAG TPA: NUDIX hydrolase [Candidatus Saccharimonadales bacterium]|nr:NUDIX hydrolase [Candidatus Saccharimonadales bacterium]
MRTQADNPWKKVSSRIAYQSPWLTVREDKIINPGGEEGLYSVIESKPGVIVIALTERREIYLIESFRYPLQAWRWEIPGGGIDGNTAPLKAAQNELAEELGFTAKKWTQLGDMYPSNNGPLNDHNYVFVAQDLQKTATHHEAGEAIREPQAFSIQDVFKMVSDGELTDGQSLGALLHFKLWLDK